MKIDEMTSGARFLLGMGTGALLVGVFELLLRLKAALEVAL
jgi:hypothetical protein